MNNLRREPEGKSAEGACTRMAQAWQWLCEQRENAPEGADCRDIRWQVLNTGPEWLTHLTHEVLRGEYRLVPLQLQGKSENRKAVWGARDALVLKWAALSLQNLLPLHPTCEHVKGHGGGRVSIMQLHGLLTQDECDHRDERKTPETDSQLRVSAGLNDDAVRATVRNRQYPWVCRTDIRGYYRHINKQTLINQVRQHVPCPVLRDLVDQYVHYTVEEGGTFHTPEKGISRGCPLSPLMGALHLYNMDEHFAKQGNIHYARYMDDIIILAKSRWQLRRHTKRLMLWLNEYGFDAHPDKTYIGRTGKGFDWMGAWLTHEGGGDISPRAKTSHCEKVRRLYERLARVPRWRSRRAQQEVHATVSGYRKRWTIWATTLLAASATVAQANPIIVIASGNQAGDTGARFNTKGSSLGWAQATDWGGLCLSTDSYYCAPSSATVSASQTPLGWGVKALGTALRNLVLVPAGTASLSCAGCGANTVASLNLSSGDAVTKGGTRYSACPPDPSTTRATYSTSYRGGKCPYDNGDNPWPATAAPATLTYNVSLAAYAIGPLAATSVPFPNMYMALHTMKDIISPLSVPSAIIISGLNCNMSPDSATVVDLGRVTSGRTADTLAATSSLQIRVTCANTNSADPAATVSMGVSFLPGPGMAAQDRYKIVSSKGDQPGFYGVITYGLNPGCSGGLPLDGSQPSLVHKYAPGDDGGTHVAAFTFNLCSTGAAQSTGDYSLKATARLVNF